MFSCEVALPLGAGAGVGPFVRGDETKIGRRGGWRQAGGGKNFDRYGPVTLWSQEKRPDLHGWRSGGVGSLRRSSGDTVEGVVRQRRVMLGRLDGRPPRSACHGVDISGLGDALRDVAGAELMERGVHAQ